MPADPNGVTPLVVHLKNKHEITGKAFFVSNQAVPPFGGAAGSDNSSLGTSELQPFATIDFAIGQCLAGRGDAIFVLGGHSETITSSITLDVAGVQIIGLPIGAKKPTVTVNGAIDAFTITAANCRISNITATIVTTDAATALFNVAAAFTKLDNIKMIPSATSVNVVDCITLASGADDCEIENTYIANTVVAVNSFLNIEAAVARLTLKGNRWMGDCATAGIIDAAAATFLLVEDNTIMTIGTTIPCAILDSNPTGVVDNNRFLGTHTTIASNFQGGNAIRQARSFVLEATDNSVQATNIIPALDVE